MKSKYGWQVLAVGLRLDTETDSESGDTSLAGFETGLESADVSPVVSAGGRRS